MTRSAAIVAGLGTALLALVGCGPACEPSGAPRPGAAPPPERAARQPDARPQDGGPADAGQPASSHLDLARPLSRPTPPGGGLRFLGRLDEEILDTIRTKRPIAARGTGVTSVSLHLNLEGEVDAAFKPRTKRGQRWAGEIAAYRLGRLLGVGRVPPSTSRRFRLSTLEALLEDDPEALARLREEAVVDASNIVVGAMSYWVPVINAAEVEREDQLERWTVWLRQGQAIPPERLSLAQQLSDTIAFDSVTGNWDRWSGGNVLMGPDMRTLQIMDNNAAFNVRMAESLQRHLDLPLAQVERWSAGLYRRLVALSAEDLRAELAQDPDGALLLSDAQIAAVLVRRDRVVERIERLVDRYGRDAVLCFP